MKAIRKLLPLQSTPRLIVLVATACLLIPLAQARTVNVTPSNFASKLSSGIANGDTVILAGGNYTMTTAMWNNVASKSNVRYYGNGRYGSNPTVLNSTGTRMPRVRIDGKGATIFQGMRILNAALFLRNCNNHRLNYIYAETTRKPQFAGDSLFNGFLARGYQTNLDSAWRFRNETGKAYSTNSPTGYTFNNTDCTNSSDVKGAVDVSRIQGSGVVTISGANASRWWNAPTGGRDFEDHGIYVRSGSVNQQIKIDNCSMKGWTDTGAGQMVKIKATQNVVADRITGNRSGIIIRTGNNFSGGGGDQITKSILVKRSTVSAGDINCYFQYNEGEAIRIENNTIQNGTVQINSVNTNPTKINRRLRLISTALGGVFNNKTKQALDIRSGIRNSGNTRL